MGRRLVLLRHGLTAWNAEHRFQGQADTELTETGVLQAKAAATALAAYESSMVWSSDLTRAAITAQYVAEASGADVVPDARLREVHVGAFQGLTHAEAVERFGVGPWDYGDHGGESDAATGERVAAALTDAAVALPDGRTAVLVSHGAAMRSGLLRFLGWPLEQVRALGPLDNCGWIELIDEPGTWFQSAPWRLAAYNRVTPIS
ncbi:histidine phosphatase family protein [Nocardioides sp. Iso805N]|uniref:histidine phosphatase family protein n=1 Tax=Nocardioides sp. Iso805N TaxID=1283287 RepID=UPI000379F919|nr:histidine phosphatase family protein [Nocardioides sp. Iso805N]